MTTLYNCRHSGDQYRITKFDSHFNLESSYLCTSTECECPAGHRHTCRHREMLPKFIQREYVGDEWFFDYDRGGWVQGPTLIDPAPGPDYQLDALAPTKYLFSEEDCIGHIASEYDARICANCGVHIDSFRSEVDLPANAEGASTPANSSFLLDSEPLIISFTEIFDAENTVKHTIEYHTDSSIVEYDTITIKPNAIPAALEAPLLRAAPIIRRRV